jgi:acetoacetyl-CoA synthetase
VGETGSLTVMQGNSQAGTNRLFRSIRAGRKWLRGTNTKIPSSQCSYSVEMRFGDEEPPLFIIPGASGSILELAPLVSELTVPMSVYAIAIKGRNEGESPDERIEDIAQHCISVITAIRANGPYLLMGYSIGGVIALEIARQLNAAGRTVPLTVLLASYPSEKIWPLRCHFEVVGRETRASFHAIANSSWGGGVRHLFDRFGGLLTYLVQIFFRLCPSAPVSPGELTATTRRVYVASLTALKNYRPAPYEGKVVLVAPLEKQRLDPESPARVWQKFSINVEVRSVPGSHSNMIDANAATAAAEISGLIARARTDQWTPNHAGSPDLSVRETTNASDYF